MGNENDQDVVSKLDEIAKEIRRIAEFATVLKVAFIASIIALLAVLFKNFM